MSEEPEEWSEADLASLSEKLAGLSLTDGERAAFAALLENDVAGFGNGLDLFSFGLRPPSRRGVSGSAAPNSGVRANKTDPTKVGEPRTL